MTATDDQNQKRPMAQRMMDGATFILKPIHKTPDFPRSADSLSQTTPIQADRSIFFIDALRLTRDCLTEIIEDQCPDLAITSLAPADLKIHGISGSFALIVFNLHETPVGVAARMLRAAQTEAHPPILLITNRDERSEAVEAMEHGVAGLLRSDTSVELLIAAIRLVIAGGNYFPADTLTAIRTDNVKAKNSL